MDLSNLNWDNISKTIGTIGDTAQSISGAVNALKGSKVASSTITPPRSSGNSGLLALVGIGLLFVLKGGR
jgi:hypothetical protein